MPLYFVAEGYRVPVSNMIDVDGDETCDPTLAVSIVGQLPDGKWLAIECREGDLINLEQ